MPPKIASNKTLLTLRLDLLTRIKSFANQTNDGSEVSRTLPSDERLHRQLIAERNSANSSHAPCLVIFPSWLSFLLGHLSCPVIKPALSLTLPWSLSLPSAQSSPNHHQLPQVISVMVGDQECFTKNRVSRLSVRDLC